MSPSHWLPIVAAIGIALITTAYGQTVGDNGGEQPGAAEGQNESPGQTEITLPVAVQGQIERITGALEAMVADPEAGADQKRAQRDLAAQEDMAFWAQAVFWAAAVQIALSFAGIFLVWRTLFYTREAVKQAKETTEAAAATVKIMRDAERPYLTPTNIKLAGFGRQELDAQEVPNLCTLSVFFEVSNVGRGPGFIRNVALNAKVCDSMATFPDMPTDTHEWSGRTVIHAIPEKPFVWPLPLIVIGIDPDEMSDLLSHSRTLFLAGYIRYFDVFGITRRTGFMFEYYPPKSQNDGAGFFIPCGTATRWYDREEKPEAQGA